MLRTKLFRAIAALVLVIGVLSAFVGIRMIKHRTIDEAQRRVQLDLSSAWSVYNAQLQVKESILKLTAGKQIVSAFCAGEYDDAEYVRNRLEMIRRNFGLDFLTVTDAEGRVLLRGAAPFNKDDFQRAKPYVAKALSGKIVSGTTLLSEVDLKLEGEGLAERAFLTFEDTPRARQTPKEEESRGMVMISAVPIVHGMQVMGVLYGGALLNRNEQLIDKIMDSVYKDETYEGVKLGTATIFLNDARITTSVTLENGNRALGTRVSKEVADKVLDNNEPWLGRAFVVRDWYLTAYDPIHDLDDKVIGMLYVGVLEEPFEDIGRQVITRYAMISAAGLAAAIIVAFMLAQRVSKPIHLLSRSAEKMKSGEYPPPVACNGACKETESLVVAFNTMVGTLKEREQKLQDANDSLTALNRSYMDMLGFVSHELKSPVATIMNYVYLLKERKIGDLNERQDKAVRNIETGSKRLVEMVRHYLNLSRIENTEIQPNRTRVKMKEDVLEGLTDSYEAEWENKSMTLDVAIPDGVEIDADLNMVKETFENMLSNAIKYGREEGRIWLKSEPVDGMIRFTVGNEGEGIPPEKQEALFKKFSRIEGESSGHKQKGTGLGLFITKHIVEAHGGTIDVHSEPGQWVEFNFTFPVAKQPEENA